MPLSFEYMAAKPIICWNRGIEEVLKIKKLLLCHPENVNEWIDAIQLLRDNHD